jgi:hypothetical protein
VSNIVRINTFQLGEKLGMIIKTGEALSGISATSINEVITGFGGRRNALCTRPSLSDK